MRLSVQLYTVRDQLANDLEGTLREIKSAGLNHVELAGLSGKTAEEWKSLLSEIGLTAKSAHIGINAFDHEYEATVADAKTLGLEYVIVPWIGRDRYENGWDKFGQELDSLGRKLIQDGLQLAYHNHAFEFEGDGSGLETLYAAASSDTLKAELDLAWVQIGGADPAAWISKMGRRCPLVHLKDYDPSRDPQWVAGGQGIVDWAAVLAATSAAGTEYGVIELDAFAGDPMDAVRASVEFFRGKGVTD
jgi:sugar phosphate isomerase/epimerase